VELAEKASSAPLAISSGNSTFPVSPFATQTPFPTNSIARQKNFAPRYHVALNTGALLGKF
jgi:hypothetical protein